MALCPHPTDTHLQGVHHQVHRDLQAAVKYNAWHVHTQQQASTPCFIRSHTPFTVDTCRSFSTVVHTSAPVMPHVAPFMHFIELHMSSALVQSPLNSGSTPHQSALQAVSALTRHGCLPCSIACPSATCIRCWDLNAAIIEASLAAGNSAPEQSTSARRC